MPTGVSFPLCLTRWKLTARPCGFTNSTVIAFSLLIFRDLKRKMRHEKEPADEV